MKQFILLFGLCMLFGCASKISNDNIFDQNWEVSPVEGVFKMDDWIIWGGSVIKADDGKYYMFASRWPKKLSMSAWITNSEIVLAVSDTPEGPYKFKQVVLPSRGKDYWDGMITHNPNIQYHDGKYILFYTGSTYDFDQPIDTAPVIHEDGSVLLIYKSAPVPYPERNKNRKLRFGVLTAYHYLGEYKRMGTDNKIRIKPIDTDVEDPYIRHDGTKYLMLAKCMNKSITGEKGAGFIATSKDGLEWEAPENPAAYGKTLNLSDGTTEKMKKLERQQILIENGKPTHVFFACTNSKSEIFNIVRPLKK